MQYIPLRSMLEKRLKTLEEDIFCYQQTKMRLQNTGESDGARAIETLISEGHLMVIRLHKMIDLFSGTGGPNFTLTQLLEPEDWPEGTPAGVPDEMPQAYLDILQVDTELTISSPIPPREEPPSTGNRMVRPRMGR